MRSLGTYVLEAALQHVRGLPNEPVARRMLSREETERLLRTPLPEHGTDPRALVDQLVTDVFPHVLHADHPRFYAFVPSPTNWVSIVADLLVSANNAFVGHWLAGPTATQVELVVIDWLTGLCGLPGTAGGVFVSGGSMANLTGVAAAREARLGGPDSLATWYCSDQTHSSVAKGVRLLGFRRDQRRTVPTDADLRLSVTALEQMIAEDKAAGRRPFCVVANGGTTNTGAVDPLDAVADVCEREGLWLHVDGAYGAAAVISERGKSALRGLDRADSITLDPHKWLFQPYEIGCLLVRDAATLRAAFRLSDDDHADYLTDVTRHIQSEVNLYEMGPQLTRSFKAAKLWLSLRTFGLSEFRRAVDIGLDLAEAAERALREDGRWEVVTPARMGVVTFRWRGDGRLGAAAIDALTARVVDAMREEGYALIMSTQLKGRPAFRVCAINPTGTVDEVREALLRLAGHAERLSSAE